MVEDWFEWNGEPCTSYGIIVSEQPNITLPNERAEFVDIPGRSGSLTQLEGEYVYDDLELTASCFVMDTKHYADIAGYLRGSGKVKFACRPQGFYYARITNQIPFEKVVAGNQARTFAINFRCKPFFYLDGASEITVTKDYTVTNPGIVPAEPIIKIAGKGDVTLTIGDYTIELSDLDGSIILDSELQEAYNGAVNMNANMKGDFPLLKPGDTTITWDGSITSVLLTPNWRTL